MIQMLSGILSTIAGLVVFAGAYYTHQKVRLTRTACVMAMIGGFITLAGAIGSWVNQYAVQLGVICAVGVAVGIFIIVADIKGKKKGADRPALFAFFLVPIFFVSGIAAVGSLTKDLREGVQKNATQMQKLG